MDVGTFTALLPGVPKSLRAVEGVVRAELWVAMRFKGVEVGLVRLEGVVWSYRERVSVDLRFLGVGNCGCGFCAWVSVVVVAAAGTTILPESMSRILLYSLYFCAIFWENKDFH